MHIEAGGGSGTQASINDADIRALIGKNSGAVMSFSEWHGASYQPTLQATYTSDLTSRPSWMYEGSGNKSSSNWGFDSTGMWINGNSSGYTSWPIVTLIPELNNGIQYAYATNAGVNTWRKAILKVSVYKNHNCADHGIAVGKMGHQTGTNNFSWPSLYNFWADNTSRIVPMAYNCSSPTYFPYSGTYSWTGYGSPSYVMNWSYWMGIRITMIPQTSCQVEMFGNNWTSSSSVSYSTSYRRVNSTHTNSGMMGVENISPNPGSNYGNSNGGYQFFFDAEQDDTSYKSYFRDLSIEVWG